MGGIASPEVRWLAMTWGGRDCFAKYARNDMGRGTMGGIASPEVRWLAMTGAGDNGRDCFARRTLARNDMGAGRDDRNAGVGLLRRKDAGSQ